MVTGVQAIVIARKAADKHLKTRDEVTVAIQRSLGLAQGTPQKALKSMPNTTRVMPKASRCPKPASFGQQGEAICNTNRSGATANAS